MRGRATESRRGGVVRTRPARPVSRGPPATEHVAHDVRAGFLQRAPSALSSLAMSRAQDLICSSSRKSPPRPCRTHHSRDPSLRALLEPAAEGDVSAGVEPLGDAFCTAHRGDVALERRGVERAAAEQPHRAFGELASMAPGEAARRACASGPRTGRRRAPRRRTSPTSSTSPAGRASAAHALLVAGRRRWFRRSRRSIRSSCRRRPGRSRVMAVRLSHSQPAQPLFGDAVQAGSSGRRCESSRRYVSLSTTATTPSTWRVIGSAIAVSLLRSTGR